MAGEGLEISARFVVEPAQVGVGDEFEQVLVAGEVFGEQPEVIVGFAVFGAAVLFEAGALGHVKLATDERLDAGSFGGLVESDGTEQVTVIGEGQGGHAEFGGSLHQTVDPASPVEQGVVGVNVEVDKARIGRHGGRVRGVRIEVKARTYKDLTHGGEP